MKKIAYIFAATALMALAASCEKEMEPATVTDDSAAVVDETTPEEETTFAFTATMGDETKATIDGDTPKWESGDKIGFRAFSSDPSMATIPSGRVAGPSVTKLVSSGLASGGSSSATFDFSATGATKDKIDAANFYVAWTLPDPSNDNSFNPVNIYSDNTTIAAESDKAYGFWVYYGWCADGFLAENAQTFGRVQARVAYSQDRNLAFKNVYHLLKFSSHCNDASYAVLTSLDGTTNICDSRVKVIFDSATETISSVVPFGGLPKTSIYLDMENYGGNGTDYYFALMPGYTIPGFTIKIYDSSDNELQTFTYSSNFTTVRNKITTITNFDGRSTLSRKPQLLQANLFNRAVKTLASQANGGGVIDSEFTSDYDVTGFAVSLGDSGSYSEEAGVCTKVSADGSLFDIWATYSAGTVTIRTAAPQIAAPAYGADMFNAFKELTSASFLTSIDLTAITNAGYMFAGCNKLTTVPTLNMPSVTSTADMFDGCTALTSLNLSGIEGNLTNVSYMFYACTNLGSIVFSDNFETFSCTFYQNMFKNCTSLRSIVMKGFHIGQTAIPSAQLATKLEGVLTNVTNCVIYYSDLESEGTYTFSNCWAALSLDDYSTGISNITWNNGRP